MTLRSFCMLSVLALLPMQVAIDSYAQASSLVTTQPLYREGELLVKYKTDQALASAASSRAGIRAGRIGRSGRLAHLHLAAGMDVQGMQRWYARQPDVEYAEPNYIVRKAATPNDTSFNLQWALRNTGQNVNSVTGTAGADIGAVTAWDRDTGSSTVIVALLDTGIDYTHPDLAGNVWTNPGEIPGNGIDDDMNGWTDTNNGTYHPKIDDIHGWNFVSDNNNPMDDDSHGSHVAGIIGAVGDNSEGVAGINWQVSLMPLKVLAADGFGASSNIVAAIDYAIAEQVQVINISIAYGCGDSASQSEREALDRARAAGILVAIAAGNDGCDNDSIPTYPASYALNNLLAVGASDQFDQRASYTRGGSSSFGAQRVHLFAPGKNIYSTLIQSADGYGYESGTSMAAPQVAGAAALLKSHRPELSMFQVREILLLSAHRLTALAGLAVTGGRLDLAAAMDYDLNGSVPVQPSHFFASKINDSRVDLSWLDDSTIETGWKLERRSDPDADFTTIATLTSATLIYQDTSVLTGEGTYNGYRVRAYNGVGDSAPGNEVKLLTAPLAPDTLEANGQGLVVTLTWRDRSARESGYRVERATGGGLFSEIANLSANRTQYQDDSVKADTEYRYRVRAHSEAAGFSNYSPAVVITPNESGDGGTHVGCFIATAAYGSALHPRVNALRQFRDVYLMTNAVGRAFVHAYYRASPPLANFIARHDWLRAGVRTLLWPLAWLAEALVPDANAGAFFRPPEKPVAEAAQADTLAIELRVERQLLVKVKPAVDADALLRAQGATRIEEISPRLFLADFADAADRTRAERALSASLQVEYAEANRVVSRPRTP